MNPDPDVLAEVRRFCEHAARLAGRTERAAGRVDWLAIAEERARTAEQRIAAGLAALAEAEAVARTGKREEVVAAIGNVGKELRGGSDK